MHDTNGMIRVKGNMVCGEEARQVRVYRTDNYILEVMLGNVLVQKSKFCLCYAGMDNVWTIMNSR